MHGLIELKSHFKNAFTLIPPPRWDETAFAFPMPTPNTGKDIWRLRATPKQSGATRYSSRLQQNAGRATSGVRSTLAFACESHIFVLSDQRVIIVLKRALVKVTRYLALRVGQCALRGVRGTFIGPTGTSRKCMLHVPSFTAIK